MHRIIFFASLCIVLLRNVVVFHAIWWFQKVTYSERYQSSDINPCFIAKRNECGVCFCTLHHMQVPFAKFTVTPQSVLWSPIPQLSYLDVNASVLLNYMDVLMTQTCSFACKLNLRFSWGYLWPVTNFILFYFLLVCMLFYCLELNVLLRLEDDLVFGFLHCVMV
jgi:hypothetical protein